VNALTGRQRAIARINLEETDVIPETEYCSNWELIRHYSGLDPADPEERGEAADAFCRELGFEFRFSTSGEPVPRSERGRVSDMGHAEFLEGGVDKRETVSLPFQSPEEVLEFDPVEEYGLYDDFDELVDFYQQMHERNRNTDEFLRPLGFYHTMISACIEAFGWDMFLTAVGVDPDGFAEVLDGFLELNLQLYSAMAQTGAEYFLCHDDMVWTEGAIFHPDWYRKHLFPRYEKLWEPLKEAGMKILFCSDGDFTEFVDDFVELGVDGLIFEPMTDFEYICEKYGDQIAIISSKVDCRTLTFGTKEDIRAEVEESFEIAGDLPGWFIAVGNHIPSNVPVENGIYYLDLVHEMRHREG
jgi:hypothetical protein